MACAYLAFGIVAASLLGSSAPARAGGVDDFITVFKGLEIAPVKLNLRGKDVALIGLGSYIVNAQAGCNDCHTSPPYAEGGDPHMGQRTRINKAGYLAGGTPFGPFLSRNLTPDSKGRPAGLTLTQFLKVMKHGTDFKDDPALPSPILQVMPWPIYANMRDIELRAIYEYLRAIPHAETPAPPPPAP
jgi:hypothetical protein